MPDALTLQLCLLAVVAVLQKKLFLFGVSFCLEGELV